MNFKVLDHTCARMEHLFNKIGWIPYASWVSGSLRIAVGKIMVIAGLAMAAYKFLKGVFSNNPALAEEAGQFAGYALHGIGNICRGFVEIFPFVNLTALFYDAFVGRFCYSSEILETGVTPLNPYHDRFAVVIL